MFLNFLKTFWDNFVSFFSGLPLSIEFDLKLGNGSPIYPSLWVGIGSIQDWG